MGPISETYLAKMMETKQLLPTKKNDKVTVNDVIVRVILSDDVEYPIKGKIDYISNKIDPLTGTIQMRAAFRNPDEKLIPGGYVTVKVEKVKKMRRLLIFQPSILADQLGNFVYTVGKDDIIHKKYIRKGDTMGTQIIVKEGLEKGEMVIVGGVLRVRPGMKVKSLPADKNVSFSAIISDALLKEEGMVDSSKADTQTAKNNKN